MNFSGSGISYSVGPRGASVTVGQRGTYLNTGIPGTGLYSRQRLDGTSTPRPSSAKPRGSMEITVGVKDDGTVYFNDQYGDPLAENIIAAAKRQKGDVTKNLIQQKCDAEALHVPCPRHWFPVDRRDFQRDPERR